mgnify:CR=1 FL=1
MSWLHVELLSLRGAGQQWKRQKEHLQLPHQQLKKVHQQLPHQQLAHPQLLHPLSLCLLNVFRQWTWRRPGEGIIIAAASNRKRVGTIVTPATWSWWAGHGFDLSVMQAQDSWIDVFQCSVVELTLRSGVTPQCHLRSASLVECHFMGHGTAVNKRSTKFQSWDVQTNIMTLFIDMRGR